MKIYLHEKDIPKTCFGCMYAQNVWGANRFEMSADCVLINQRVSCMAGVDAKCPLQSIEKHDEALLESTKDAIKNIIIEEFTSYAVTGIPSNDTVSVDEVVERVDSIERRLENEQSCI